MDQGGFPKGKKKQKSTDFLKSLPWVLCTMVVTSEWMQASKIWSGNEGRWASSLQSQSGWGCWHFTNFSTNYHNVLRKTETITVDEGLVLRLEFKAFGIENHGRYAFNHLKVVDGDWTILMDKTCSTALPPVLISDTNHVSTGFETVTVRLKNVQCIYVWYIYIRLIMAAQHNVLWLMFHTCGVLVSICCWF